MKLKQEFSEKLESEVKVEYPSIYEKIKNGLETKQNYFDFTILELKVFCMYLTDRPFSIENFENLFE